MQAIRDYEIKQADEAKPAIKDHKAAMDTWEAKRSGIKEEIRQPAKSKGSTQDLEDALRNLEHDDQPESPRVPRLIYGDATPEALKWNLAKGWPSGGVVSSEAGLVFGAHGMGKDSIPVLPPAADTEAAWVMFHDAIERELRSGGELYDVRDVASKTADNAARIAALFHIFENSAGGAIGLEAFEGASRIAAWHLHEARRFYGELTLPKEQANAARLDSWLLDYCRREKTTIVSWRDVQRHVTPRRLRQKTALDFALDELIEADRVRLIRDGERKEIHINPALLKGGGP